MSVDLRPTVMVALFLLLSATRATAQTPSAAPGCWVRGERADLELRGSPFDSASVTLDPGTVKVCYSQPRKLGRPIMGRLVSFGEPWRLGANEATAIHLPVRARVAGVVADPGWYSLYAVPGERAWGIVVNRDWQRWGIPIDDEVMQADVGSGTVPVSTSDGETELLTLRFQRTAPASADLVVEWERTTVRIPVELLDDAARERDGRADR